MAKDRPRPTQIALTPPDQNLQNQAGRLPNPMTPIIGKVEEVYKRMSHKDREKELKALINYYEACDKALKKLISDLKKLQG